MRTSRKWPIMVIVRSIIAGIAALAAAGAGAQPVSSTDLAVVPPNGAVGRILGSVGEGTFGVPVAGGLDLDGDGLNDYAFSAMVASPDGRTRAGEIFVVFGDGNIGGAIDTAAANPRVLRIIGDQDQENAGSELWMDDVTGDGLGDLLICRQNFSPGGTRSGAGALTLIPGSAQLRTIADAGSVIDLRVPAGLSLTTLLGANAGDRLGIWARTGDVTGDGVADIVVGADRQTQDGEFDAGAAYVIRGGSHLEADQTVDLAQFGIGALVGNLARIRPPPNSGDFHFGATVQIADLDGNGRGEVLAAAALNRAGASLPPVGGSGNGTGGSPEGTVYIAWDDNFAGDWMPAPDFVIGTGSGAHTIIDGGPSNVTFGEELLGGLDYDNDGQADLFAGDLAADGFAGISRSNAGLGHVIYRAGTLKGLEFDLGAPPVDFQSTTVIGPVAGAIAGDTGVHGDFNDDGIADLAFSSPHDSHSGRRSSGTLHIFLGRDGTWPAFIDLSPAAFPDFNEVAIHEVNGAHGEEGSNKGDTLAYSAASGDLNGDGVVDIITNEMLGDGLAAGTEDVGNMILLDANRLMLVLFADGFEGHD